jgi:hypothetical protein
VALECHDAEKQDGHPWVLRINEEEDTAEMIVHVPADSLALGVPSGNRLGDLLASERGYSITIPETAWARMQSAFEIDRYSGSGTLKIGEERYGEVAVFKLRCTKGSSSPEL